MGLLAVIFLVAGLVWTSLLLIYRPNISGSWVSFGTLSAFFASILCGYDFFHKDFGPLPLTIDRFILGASCVIAVSGLLLNRHRLPNLSGLDICVLAWFGALTFSTFTTDFGYKDKLPVSRLLFYNFLPVVSYFLLRAYPLSSAQQRGLLWALVGLGLYLGFTGLAEWRRWHGLVFPKYIISTAFAEFYGRGRGPLLNPVINGILLSLSGAACLLLFPLTRRRYWLPLLIAFGVIGIGVISTLTRSCWIGFAASTIMICLAPLSWRQRFVATFLCGAFGFIVVASFSSQLNRFKRDENVSVEDMSQSAALRPVLATVAWEMFQDRPLNGVGFGQYNKYKKPYHQVENPSLPLQMALPYVQHNVMLSYLTELGLAGLLAAVAMWLGSIRLGLQAWAANASSLESRCLGLLLLTAVINYLTNGLFHDVSIIPVANSSLLLAAALLNPSEFTATAKATPPLAAPGPQVLLSNRENLLTRPL
jgi:O-antigen ligase